MNLIVRHLIESDQADWRRLWCSYLEYYESSVPEEVYQRTFECLLDPKRAQQNGLIALHDGKAVGLVHYIYHAHNWRIEDVCYLQDLYADAAVRGKGVGRALIEAVYKAADVNGTPSVYWLTQDFNQTARRLYDQVATLTPFIKYQR
ncbi:MAG: GNAT family N-acetyltransferase [Sulfitobacter sp.]